MRNRTVTTRWSIIACAGMGALALSGCAVCRGVDFGHWAGRPENRKLIRTYNVRPTHLPVSNEFVLVLVPMGAIAEEYRVPLQVNILKEAQQNTPARVVMLEIDKHLAEYVNEKNLVPIAGLFDFREVGRLGWLLGASHVVCVWVNKADFCVPQNLDLYLAVVESRGGMAVAEMNGQFDASDQEVAMVMNDYLQGCRAREFDRPNLGMIEQSPSEYQAFVAHECMKALMSQLWKKN